jgi:hypothetical protein
MKRRRTHEVPQCVEKANNADTAVTMSAYDSLSKAAYYTYDMHRPMTLSVFVKHTVARGAHFGITWHLLTQLPEHILGNFFSPE